MVDNIRMEFICSLHNVTWLDVETRAIAIKKAEEIRSFIGYPNELNDNAKLEEFYGNLEIQPDNYIANKLRLNIIETDRSFNRLRKSIDRTDWTMRSLSTDVNAYYHQSDNSIGMLSVVCYQYKFIYFIYHIFV